MHDMPFVQRSRLLAKVEFARVIPTWLQDVPNYRCIRFEFYGYFPYYCILFDLISKTIHIIILM